MSKKVCVKDYVKNDFSGLSINDIPEVVEAVVLSARIMEDIFPKIEEALEKGFEKYNCLDNEVVVASVMSEIGFNFLKCIYGTFLTPETEEKIKEYEKEVRKVHFGYMNTKIKQ